MASYNDELDRLRERAEEAADQAGRLTEEAWPNAESRQRLQEILAYARLILEDTDDSLVPPPLIEQLEETLSVVINVPEQVRESFPAWMENLMTRVARLPPARGRDFEQQAKDAATTFQRSARGRLSSLEREFSSASMELANVHEQIEQIGDDFRQQGSTRLDELRQSITEADNQFRERLQTYETNLETERQESLKLRAEQAEVFEQTQRDRATQADARLAELETRLQERAEQVVESLESSQQRAANLVDLVATSSTAGAFSKEAGQQKLEADKWRENAIKLGLCAGGVALIAVIYAVAIEVNTSIIVAKLALAVVFAGLAGYAARQSADHRDREVRARRLELELTSFGPFTEGLNDETKEQDARVKLIDRVFVGDPSPGSGLDSANGTPTLTSAQVTLVGQLFDQARQLLK